jgi:alpha(1,3/1,4) fucosyltransferase
LSPASLAVDFRDFWPGFDPWDNFLLSALSALGPVEVTPEADLCFYSCFGTSHRRFVGCKVQVIGENLRPNFHESDFAIGFDLTPDDRFLRYPLWAWDVDTSALLRPFGENGVEQAPEFCAFLAANPHSPFRNALFEQLSRHRFVHAGGAVFNNAPGPAPRDAGHWRQSKIEWLSAFRFTIAAENDAYPGYTTEKLVDAFLAGSVPIYWGDPLVDCDFNPAAFLDVGAFGTVSRTVDAVLAVDDDAAALRRIRSVAPMDEQVWGRTASPEVLTAFLERIVASGVSTPSPREWRRRAAVGRAQELARQARIARLRDLI